MSSQSRQSEMILIFMRGMMEVYYDADRKARINQQIKNLKEHVKSFPGGDAEGLLCATIVLSELHIELEKAHPGGDFEEMLRGALAKATPAPGTH